VRANPLVLDAYLGGGDDDEDDDLTSEMNDG